MKTAKDECHQTIFKIWHKRVFVLDGVQSKKLEVIAGTYESRSAIFDSKQVVQYDQACKKIMPHFKKNTYKKTFGWSQSLKLLILALGDSRLVKKTPNFDKNTEKNWKRVAILSKQGSRCEDDGASRMHTERKLTSEYFSFGRIAEQTTLVKRS